MSDTCMEHTGCTARISMLENNDSKQWEEIAKVDEKADKIMTKLNALLVSTIIVGLGLFANIALELMKK